MTVGLHTLSNIFERFAIIKKHHYFLNSSSNSIKQATNNGVATQQVAPNEPSVRIAMYICIQMRYLNIPFILDILFSSFASLQKNGTTVNIPEKIDIDPVMTYHVLQTAAFCLMAIIIMRLKLFFTPQLCILSALLLNPKVSSMESLYFFSLRLRGFSPYRTSMLTIPIFIL